MISVESLSAGPLFGLPLPEMWFGLIFTLLATFLFLDGFDFGAGAIYGLLNTDREHEAVLAAVGPFWDGNEVWLVVFGGTLFAAFPAAYANLFSRHYLLMFGILGALILRGLAPEMYEQRHDERWQRAWSVAFVAGSVLAPFLLGVFAGNWLVGNEGSVSLIGVVVGFTLTLLTVVSGAAFLRLKAPLVLPERVSTYGQFAVVGYLVAVVGTLAILAVRLPGGLLTLLHPTIVVLVVISIGLTAGYIVAMRRGESLLALGAAAVLTYGLITVVGIIMYPAIDPATGATISETIVSTLPLNLMSIAAALLLPLVASYFVVLYSAFSGPISPEEAY
ncbi:cytochrome D ubiquinol oxidase subunit II [Halorubrum salipaludis]|mgnify:CR=1 FL=1|jgi:cytochrome d ubiquinol oxidase subunit II|uniref:Cytochrome D ubiquinol oxidase subunit II n=1 Tax=Halorubrum salipaludis TaxID=2032630 RepID=A0A2A2F879_9EURY|nr:cytochrome d ubiquinol oxidase subunit II [Halorubrum salipaludis]PAU80805.1 cytochrome D ubiquinol oxidase subunit II [Halorubrum salipaludis]